MYINSVLTTGINPMDNLRFQELRAELELRGLDTSRKRKPELEKNFDELWRGIFNVPALLKILQRHSWQTCAWIGMKLHQWSPYMT